MQEFLIESLERELLWVPEQAKYVKDYSAGWIAKELGLPPKLLSQYPSVVSKMEEVRAGKHYSPPNSQDFLDLPF